MEGILLINFDGTYQLFIKDKNLNIWKPAGPADIEYFKTDISEKNAITADIPLNKYIGFMTSMKKIIRLDILRFQMIINFIQKKVF